MNKKILITCILISSFILCTGCNNKDEHGWNREHTVYTNVLGVEITSEEYDSLVEFYGNEQIIDTISQEMVWTALGKMTLHTALSYSITGIMDWEDYLKFNGQEIIGDDYYACKYVFVDFPEYSLYVQSEAPDCEIDKVCVVLTETNVEYCDLSEKDKISALINVAYSE